MKKIAAFARSKIRKVDYFRVIMRTPVIRLTAAIAAACLAASSCSTTRLLGEGEYRLAKSEVEVGKVDGKKVDGLKVESYIKQKPSGGIFGLHPLISVYNWSGRDTSKVINRVIRAVGKEPMVYDQAQTEASVENVRRHLEYIGYYDSEVTSETDFKEKRKLANVKYYVTLGNRYEISEVAYEVPEGEFREDFMADTANVTIRKGGYLSESDLEDETERSAAYFRQNGYFGFTKSYYSFEADTLARDGKAKLKMKIGEYTRNQTPDQAVPHRKYTIGKVTISHDKALNFKERVLRNMNTIRPGDLYSEKTVNTTYSRLTALKLFSGVNIEMTPRDTAEIVDCDIRLTSSRLQGFKVNLEGSTNSTGLVGISPQFSYYHKNIFGGGQWLDIGFLGNFQFKYNDRSVRSNEFGVSASISFPEFLGLSNSRFKGPQIPRTEISASYNYQNRPEYTRNMISTSFGYTGTLFDKKFSYQLYPVQAKIVRLYNLDPDFYNTLASNPIMRNAYQNHFDVGMSATGYYTTCADLNPKVSYSYVRLGFDLSGNLISLFNGLMKEDEYGSRMIWGTPYSQYVKTELTLGRTIVFGHEDRQALAFRLLGGIGYAYGNSSSMPFEKQFYSGGANSMRGWQARSLGPGKAKADQTFVIPSQTGDMKLEFNMEYRFPLFWKVNGALFLDTGNVWTLQETEGTDAEQTHFTLGDIGDSIAANWGAGLRIDLDFLVLRLDCGVRLLDPSLDGSHWCPSHDWTSDNLSLHFGVGYPF